MIKEDIQEKELELTPEEIKVIESNTERTRRHTFEQSLKDRYSILFDHIAACHQLGISNPELYFNQQILYHKSEDIAEERMLSIEKKDRENKIQYEKTKYVENRQSEYLHIDKLLLEAIAEKEAGDDNKMKEYLVKRAAIKELHPKPQA